MEANCHDAETASACHAVSPMENEFLLQLPGSRECGHAGVGRRGEARGGAGRHSYLRVRSLCTVGLEMGVCVLLYIQQSRQTL